jgi:hypothetical protein
MRSPSQTLRVDGGALHGSAWAEAGGAGSARGTGIRSLGVTACGPCSEGLHPGSEGAAGCVSSRCSSVRP